MVYFCIIVGATTVCTVVGMICDYKIKKLTLERRKMESRKNVEELMKALEEGPSK